MKAKRFLLLGSILFAVTPILHAADGTYISQTGDWNDVGSWDSGIIADGAGFTAFFTNDVLADSTTVLGEDRTIGNITFSDADNSAGNGFDRTISGNILTLAGTTPTLSVTQSDRTLTIGNEIAGTEGLTKAGVGTLILSSANTYTGGTSITAGTLKLSGSGSLGAAGASVAVSGGALLDLNGTNQSIAFAAGAGVGTVANNSGSGTSILTLAGPAVVNGGLVNIVDSTTTPGGKVGVVITANTQPMSNLNTYSGGTTVNAGAFMYLNASVPLGAGTGTINLPASGATTSVSSGLVVDGAIYANDVSGAGYVHNNVNGASTAVFTGTLNTSGTFNFRNSAAAFDFAGSGDSTLSGVIGPAGGNGVFGPNFTVSTGRIIKSGTGTLTLTGANAYTGTTTISGGILALSGSGTLGTTGSYAGAIINDGTFNLGSSANQTLSGAISGSGVLNKTGSGTLTLTGANTYTGATQIDGGMLVFGNKAAQSAGTTATAAAAGTVGLGVHDTTETFYSAVEVGALFNTNTLAGINLNAASGVAIDTTGAGGSFDQNVALTADRSLTKLGTGILTLSQANTYTGGTAITAGTLQLSGSGSLGAAGANVAVSSGALLDLNGTNQSIAFINGTGTGTVANNSVGGTSILTLSAVPAASSIVIADNTNSSSGKVAVVIAINTQTLSGSNTYSGGTTVNAGAWLGNLGTNAGTGAISLTAANSGVWTNVNVSVANDITGAGFVSINQSASGTLTLTGNLTNTGNYTFRNRDLLQTYDFAGNGTTSGLSGVIGGPGGVNGGGGTTAARAGSIIKSGTGLLTLSGNNVYFGNTTVNGGILRIAHNNALGNAANGTTVSGNTLSGRLELQGGIAVAGETLTLVGRQGIAASAPALSNFSGNNSWGGNINLTTGGIEYNIESQADTLTIAGNINPGTTTADRFLNFMGAGHTNVTGQILAGSAATVVLTKTGGGTLTLTNTNAYTGATNVNAGTLHIGATGSTHANSAVTVSNSGSALIVNGTINGTLNANASTTVSGSGTITGAATINGNLNPGTSPGVLSFSNNLTLLGSTTNLEILGLNRGTNYDGVNVSGVLAYGGILNLAFGTTFGSDEVFNLFDLFTGTSGTFSEVNLTGDYATTLTNNSGVWTGTTNLGNQSWSFAQSTGDLTLTVIPEPSAALLGGLGALLLLRRRRR